MIGGSVLPSGLARCTTKVMAEKSTSQAVENRKSARKTASYALQCDASIVKCACERKIRSSQEGNVFRMWNLTTSRGPEPQNGVRKDHVACRCPWEPLPAPKIAIPLPRFGARTSVARPRAGRKWG